MASHEDQYAVEPSIQWIVATIMVTSYIHSMYAVSVTADWPMSKSVGSVSSICETAYTLES